jgi:hypothetical protein
MRGGFSMKKSTSTEFLLISESVNRLVQGIWGNAPRAEPVREIKRCDRALSVDFGPRREKAAALLRTAGLRGELSIHVRSRSNTQERNPLLEPQQVPPKLLKQVLPIRCGLPDHPTHVLGTPAARGGLDDALWVLLQHGELVVRRSDFIRWYKGQRAKGSWASQLNTKAAPRRGRPTKDTQALRNAVSALMRDGEWRATDGITALGRLLAGAGREPPSDDTLVRVVDELYRVTGERALRRRVRKPPRAPRA